MNHRLLASFLVAGAFFIANCDAAKSSADQAGPPESTHMQIEAMIAATVDSIAEGLNEGVTKQTPFNQDAMWSCESGSISWAAADVVFTPPTLSSITVHPGFNACVLPNGKLEISGGGHANAWVTDTTLVSSDYGFGAGTYLLWAPDGLRITDLTPQDDSADDNDLAREVQGHSHHGKNRGAVYVEFAGNLPETVIDGAGGQVAASHKLTWTAPFEFLLQIDSTQRAYNSQDKLVYEYHTQTVAGAEPKVTYSTDNIDAIAGGQVKLSNLTGDLNVGSLEDLQWDSAACRPYGGSIEFEIGGDGGGTASISFATAGTAAYEFVSKQNGAEYGEIYVSGCAPEDE